MGPARGKGEGERRMKRLNIDDILYIYICTYIGTGLHARISKILAKIRSSMRRIFWYWCWIEFMTRRDSFFEIRVSDTSFALTFVTISFMDLLVRLRIRVCAINGSRLYRVT